MPGRGVTVGISPPDAFLSYAHIDDQDDRKITAFWKALQREVCRQTGRDINIFLDRDGIDWGETWEKRIDEALDTVILLVPILTPGFFNSTQCRRELRRFLEREQQLKRDDLVLPVYWIETPWLEDPTKRAQDGLAQTLHTRQYIDWRDLRFKQPNNGVTQRTVARLATRLRDALDPPDYTVPEIKFGVVEVLRHTRERVCAVNSDPLVLVNLLVDAIRDSGRLRETDGVRAFRWVCQSRIDRPPGALRESTADPVDTDFGVEPARADAFHGAVASMIQAATTRAAISVKGDTSVVELLLDVVEEIFSRTGATTAGEIESVPVALRSAVHERLGVLRERAEWLEEQARQQAATSAEEIQEARVRRDVAERELQATKVVSDERLGRIKALEVRADQLEEQARQQAATAAEEIQEARVRRDVAEREPEAVEFGLGGEISEAETRTGGSRYPTDSTSEAGRIPGSRDLGESNKIDLAGIGILLVAIISAGFFFSIWATQSFPLHRWWAIALKILLSAVYISIFFLCIKKFLGRRRGGRQPAAGEGRPR